MDLTRHADRKEKIKDSTRKNNKMETQIYSRRQLIKVAGAVAVSLNFPALNLRAKQTNERLIVILSMDGLDPRYLEKSDIPNLRRLIKGGTFKTVR